jgi:Fungal specific transcription factor domain
LAVQIYFHLVLSNTSLLHWGHKLHDERFNNARFPLFHRPTLLRKISTREYLSDKAHFAMIMAICALASARARDGALYPSKWKPGYLRQPAAEEFSSAAIAAVPSDWSEMGCLDWMRTCAVLALVGIQFDNIKMMHQYLGTYHTLVAMDGLHDEKNWPRQMDMVQVEERRRLVSHSFSDKRQLLIFYLVLVHLHPGNFLVNCLGRHDTLPRNTISSSLSQRARRRDVLRNWDRQSSNLSKD